MFDCELHILELSHVKIRDTSTYSSQGPLGPFWCVPLWRLWDRNIFLCFKIKNGFFFISVNHIYEYNNKIHIFLSSVHYLHLVAKIRHMVRNIYFPLVTPVIGKNHFAQYFVFQYSPVKRNYYQIIEQICFVKLHFTDIMEILLVS